MNTEQAAPMKKHPGLTPHLAWVVVILGGLYLTSLYNYLLFHSVAELFSIGVAVGMFMLAWNARRFMENNYLLSLGIAYLFVAVVDTLHTLAYKGMGVFEGYGANLPTQLWIAGRYLESLSLLAAFFLLAGRLRYHRLLQLYALVTAVLLFTIFAGIFPDCFVEGTGLTPFKKISEYIIAAILSLTLVILYRRRRNFDPFILQLIAASLICTIVAELAFTFYVSVYGLSNLVGHYFKIISFYLIYKAIIATGLTEPYRLLFREIRQREEALAASEARYRSLFENNIDGFALHRIIKDESGRPVDYVFLEANEVFEHLTGLKPEEIAGRRVTEVLPGIENDPADWIGTYGEVALTGREIRFEQYAEALDRWFSVAAYSPMQDHFVTLFEDITDRKKAEEQVEALNENLRRHVIQIEEANKELEAFSYSVSHDLRAPLRSINAFSQILVEDYADKLDEEGRDSLERIGTATTKMSQLIDDLLTLSRVSRTEMQREAVDLSAIAAEVAAELRQDQPERRVTFMIAEGLKTEGDRNLLAVVLQNLLGNAWKFTSQRDDAVIELGRTPVNEGKTAFFVKDNGAGFDMVFADKLFKPFHRLHRDSEFPGTGIGLATVQRIIQRHGGDVWIKGEENKGATIYFTLGTKH